MKRSQENAMTKQRNRVTCNSLSSGIFILNETLLRKYGFLLRSLKCSAWREVASKVDFRSLKNDTVKQQGKYFYKKHIYYYLFDTIQRREICFHEQLWLPIYLSKYAHESCLQWAVFKGTDFEAKFRNRADLCILITQMPIRNSKLCCSLCHCKSMTISK